MRDLVRIVVPPGGCAYGTKVFTASGEEICGVSRIEIRPLDHASMVEAEITVVVSPDTIEAHPLLSLASLEEAAALRGLKLVPITN